MTPKRALVVDDSRSARAFLSRILERHSLEVDTAESAEAALEYLKRSRPDVIFMDHLMPGMDGFQAVQLIKKDPRTAMIPILMYTSQEGELYLSQARALGALGVLPKQTRPADVTKALLQLHLVEGGEGGEGGELSTTAISSTGTLPIIPPELRELVGAMLRDKSDEMRRFVVHSLDEHANKVEGHVREILEETAANLMPPPKSSTGARVGSGLMIGFSLLGLVAAAGLAWLWYQAMQQQEALTTRLRDLETQLSIANTRLESARAELAERIAAAAQAAARAENPPLLQETLALGEAPLSGPRVELVRAQLEKLLASGYRGRVELHVYPGRFCLKSAAGEAPALADADTPYAKCTEMTEQQLAALVSQRESVSFANMLAAFRKRAGDAIQLQTIPGATADTLVPYPAVSDALTAGDWNRSAAQNFRLELRLPQPTVSPPTVTTATATTATTTAATTPAGANTN